MNYVAYVHKEPASNFGVSFPDFSGCITAGKTLDEARQLAGEALLFHMQGMREDGETLPKPSNLDDLADDPNREGATLMLVSVEPLQ